MKKTKSLSFIGILCLLTMIVTNVTSQTQNTKSPQLGKASVKEVVAAMTLEEKASLVVGAGRMQGAPTGAMIGQTQSLVAGAAGTTYSVSRLGITPMVLADGPAGLRITPIRDNDKKTYYCTAFPVATLLASTWNTELVKQVGQAMGNEVLEYGADILLAPALNIQRNPLNGRNFEYYSEDPLVAGKTAAAMVIGVESKGVGTSVKHFAANNAETNRTTLDVNVSERTLREIYLEGFRIVVQEAQPWTVMSSYNLINGVYTAENPDLITTILRKDWGFKGFVMTDWGGGKDAVAQMIAGNDLIMPGNATQTQTIIKAVQDGNLNIKVLDTNVERILNIILESPRYKGYKYSDKPDLKANAEVTRQAATEGMVLLKNDSSALPLTTKIKKIAAFGNTSYEIITGGTGSGDVNEAYSVSLIEGLKNAGLTVNENLQTMYDAYFKATREGVQRSTRGGGMFGGSQRTAELVINNGIAGSMANITDAAIITIGRNSGEGRDRSSGEGDFMLTSTERELIKSVADAFHAKRKKVIVILNVCGPIETASWRSIPDAILLAWEAGQETGNSIADILTGKDNPSGKLAVTFPVNYSDVPSSKTFPGAPVPVPATAATPATTTPAQGFGRGVPAKDTYEDGIYVGYRYYETFKVKPAYEFGYGLSYTNFVYSNIKLSSAKFSNKITVTVEIKNAGNVAGKDVAQLYLTAPTLKLDKPAIELKGFAKTKLLQPGESQTLTFVLDSRSLSSFDPSVSSWIADAGKYDVKIGASSEDIRQSASFTVAKSITVKKESVAMVTKVKINEIKPKV
jgi:beta-glucosidase